MSNEMKREDFKEAAEDFAKQVKMACAIIDVEVPGAGNMLLEAVVDELKGMLPKRSCCKENDGPVHILNLAEQSMSFGDALLVLKGGGTVARKGWNGKGQYVELASNISYETKRGGIVNAGHAAIGNRALAFVGTSGVQLGWLASQADMLAEDWYIVE